MEDKKTALLKCGVRALAAYAVISFGWLAFLSIGMSADTASNNLVISGNSAFAERLMVSNLYIAFFSAVYGFSALLLKIKNLSAPAKRSLHIIANYVAAMVCFYGLHSNAKDVAPKVWITLIFMATIAFFVIYGIAALVGFLVKKLHK